MKRFSDFKIQNKLFLMFGVLIFLLIFLSIFYGVHLSGINKKYVDLLNTTVERQRNTSRAIEYMNRMNYINLTKGYWVTVDARSSEIEVLHLNYDKYCELFMAQLSDYRDNLGTATYLTEAEKQEREEILNEIEYLFTEKYRPKTDALDAALYDSDRQKMYSTVGETILIGDQISEKLDLLNGVVSLFAAKLQTETTADSQKTIILTSVLSVLLIIISIIASLFMTRMIKVPITNIENAMAEISKGNLDYAIKSDSNDELGMLAEHIGDMVDSISEMNKVATAMDQLDSRVMVTDFDYNMIYINRSLANCFGIDINDYKGQKCYQALRKLDGPCSICQLPDLGPNKESLPAMCFEYLYDDYTDEWIGGKGAIIRWVDGELVYLQTFNDETEKKRMQEELQDALDEAESASAAKSTFLANMSHEIRTPMHAVLGMAELLIQEDLSKRQYQYARDIKTSAMALLGIINDILEASKLQAGKLSLSPVHYRFDQMLDNIASVAQFLIEDKNKNIQFKFTAPEETKICLYGDDLRLRQVLLNLLGNAVKFTDEGFVELTIGVTDTKIKFTVKDSGAGIPEEDLPTLFDPFMQADIIKNRNISGTGLGLTIAKSLVDMMEGHISVESEYGHGTAFHFEIPKIPGDPSQVADIDEQEIALHAPDAKILVVDDNKTNLSVARGLLRRYNIIAETALSGEEAVEKLKDNVYDIVFMDNRMTGMSGIETTKEIREMGIVTPVIALTASIAVDARETMIKAGMNDYLSKPIIKAELIRVLQEWLPSEKLLDPPETPVSSDDSIDESHREFWEELESIDGLSISTGLDRLSGQRDEYEQTLSLSLQDIERNQKNLAAFSYADDITGLSAEAHGVKGVLANIGALELAERARGLEFASKNGDAEFCRVRLPGFLESLDEFKEALQKAFSLIVFDDDPAILPAELPNIFTRLTGALEELDLMLISGELDALDELNLSGALKAEINEIKSAVIMMDYPKAMELMKKVQRSR